MAAATGRYTDAEDELLRAVAERKKDERVLVHVRVRPLNPNEDAQAVVVSSPERRKLMIVRDPTTGQGARNFGFDRVYWSLDGGQQFDGQRDIYEDIGRLMLDHAFAGFNTCIFAYGQTGSGKTYTMMGDHKSSDPEDRGVIPRACAELFDKIDQGYTTVCQRDYDEDTPTSGAPVSPADVPNWAGESPAGNAIQSYEVHCSYYEIYNEKVYDLMDREQQKGDLRVREHPTQGPYVENLTIDQVYLYEDVQSMLVHGNKNRHTNQTKLNDRSSRSHAIFTILLKQTVFVKGELHEYVSRINLVDLAGSERTKNAGTSGDTLVEGININKSLCTLGQVIHNLAESHERQRSMYINFRDSNLTWLLRENLGGNSKTIMVATISPASSCYDESLNTLRYADRVKQIRQKAIVNEDSKTKLIRDLRQEVAHLRRENMEIQRLRHELMCLQKRQVTSALNVPHVPAGEDPYVVVLVPNPHARYPIACRMNNAALLLTDPGDTTPPRDHAARCVHPSLKLPSNADFTILHIPNVPRGAAILLKESGKTEAVFGNRASRLIPLSAECRIARDPQHKAPSKAVMPLVHGSVFGVGDTAVLRYADPSSMKADDPIVQAIMAQQLEGVPHDVRDLTGAAPPADALPPMEGAEIRKVLDARPGADKHAPQARAGKLNHNKETMTPPTEAVHPPMGAPGAVPPLPGVGGYAAATSAASTAPTGAHVPPPPSSGDESASTAQPLTSQASGGLGSARGFGRSLAGNLTREQRHELIEHLPPHLKELFDRLNPAQQGLFLATQQPVDKALSAEERKKIERTQEEYLRKLAGSSVPRVNSWNARDRDATMGLNDTEIKQYCNLNEEQRKTFDALTPELQRELLASLPAPEEFDQMGAEDLVAASDAINTTLSDLLARADAEQVDAINALPPGHQRTARALSPMSRKRFLNMTRAEQDVFGGLSPHQQEQFFMLTGRQRDEFVKLAADAPEGSPAASLTAAQARLLASVGATSPSPSSTRAPRRTGAQAAQYEQLTEQQKQTFDALPASMQQEVLARMPSAEAFGAMSPQALVEASKAVASHLQDCAARAAASETESIAALPVHLQETVQSLSPAARRRFLDMTTDEQTVFNALAPSQQAQFLALSETQQGQFLRLAKENTDADGDVGLTKLNEAQSKLLELSAPADAHHPGTAQRLPKLNMDTLNAQPRTSDGLPSTATSVGPRTEPPVSIGDRTGLETLIKKAQTATSVLPDTEANEEVRAMVASMATTLMQASDAHTAVAQARDAAEKTSTALTTKLGTVEAELTKHQAAAKGQKAEVTAAAESAAAVQRELHVSSARVADLEGQIRGLEKQQQEIKDESQKTIALMDLQVDEAQKEVEARNSLLAEVRAEWHQERESYENQLKDIEARHEEHMNSTVDESRQRLEESEECVNMLEIQFQDAQEKHAQAMHAAEHRVADRSAKVNALEKMLSEERYELETTIIQRDASEELLGRTRNAFNDLQIEYGVLSSKIQALEQTVCMKADEVQRLRELEEESQTALTTLREEYLARVAEVEENTHKVLEEKELQKMKLREYENKARLTEEQLVMKELELGHFRTLTDQKEIARAAVETQCSLLQARIEGTLDEMHRMQQEIEDVETHLREKEDAIEGLHGEKARLTEAYAKETVEQRKAREAAMQEQQGIIRELTQQLNNVQSKVCEIELKNRELYHSQEKIRNRRVQLQTELHLKESELKETKVKYLDAHTRLQTSIRRGKEGRKQIEQVRRLTTIVKEQEARIEYLSKELKESQAHTRRLEEWNANSHSSEQVERIRGDTNAVMGALKAQVIQFNPPALRQITTIVNSVQHATDPRRIFRQAFNHIRLVVTEISGKQDLNIGGVWDVDESLLGRMKTFQRASVLKALREIVVWHGVSADFTRQEMTAYIELTLNSKFLLSLAMFCQNPNMPDFGTGRSGIEDFSLRPLILAGRRGQRGGHRGTYTTSPTRERGGPPVATLLSLESGAREAVREASSSTVASTAVSQRERGSEREERTVQRSRSSPHAAPGGDRGRAGHYDPEQATPPVAMLSFVPPASGQYVPSYVSDTRPADARSPTERPHGGLVATSQRHLLNFSLPLAFEGMQTQQAPTAKNRTRSLSEKKSPPSRPLPLSPPMFGNAMRTHSPSFASLPATYREYRAIDLNDPLPLEYEGEAQKKKVEYDPKKKNFMQGTVSSQGKAINRGGFPLAAHMMRRSVRYSRQAPGLPR